MREDKTVHDGRQLVTGIDCVPQSAHTEMMNTKTRYKKTDGKMYYQLVQSFSPDEDITPETAHEIAVEFARSQFAGYEIVVATHSDADHIHSHIVFNSVSFENGRKYHSDKSNIQRLRDASDALCLKYGLSVIEPKDDEQKKESVQKMSPREYRSAERGESWKMMLIVTIEGCMKRARTKKDFIELMRSRGYDVKWTDTRKYITYTTPEGMRCRDNKLHEDKFLKGAMEFYFFKQSFYGRRTNEGVHLQDDVSFFDTVGGDDHPRLGIGSLAAGLKHLTDDESDDPEERRKRIEAQQNGEAIGVLLGTAAGLIGALSEDKDEEDEDEKYEEDYDDSFGQSLF